MSRRNTSNLKPLLRIAAFDDGYFIPRKKSKVLLVGVISRFDNRVEGLLSTKVNVDGLNATPNLIKLISKSKFKPQISAILLSGINVAGFNIFDIKKINGKLKVPVIAVFRRKPKIEKFIAGLKKLSLSKTRLKYLENAGPAKKCSGIYYQSTGCSEKIAKQIIKRTIKHSKMPEPLRLAHIIASGISTGESKR